MILIDIQVPVVNETYDFELDEEMPAGELVGEVVRLIAKKEKMSYCTEEKMCLYNINREKLLNDVCSLKGQGVRSGDRLVLI